MKVRLLVINIFIIVVIKYAAIGQGFQRVAPQATKNTILIDRDTDLATLRKKIDNVDTIPELERIKAISEIIYILEEEFYKFDVEVIEDQLVVNGTYKFEQNETYRDFAIRILDEISSQIKDILSVRLGVDHPSIIHFEAIYPIISKTIKSLDSLSHSNLKITNELLKRNLENLYSDLKELSDLKKDPSKKKYRKCNFSNIDWCLH